MLNIKIFHFTPYGPHHAHTHTHTYTHTSRTYHITWESGFVRRRVLVRADRNTNTLATSVIDNAFSILISHPSKQEALHKFANVFAKCVAVSGVANSLVQCCLPSYQIYTIEVEDK